MNDLLAVIASLPANVRYALYGAGRYAKRNLANVTPAQLQERGRELLGIIDDFPGASPLPGVPVASLAEALTKWRPDWIVLSTETLQHVQREKIEQAQRDGLAGPQLRIAAVPPMKVDDKAFNDWAEMRNPDQYFEWVKRPLAVMDQYLGGHEGRVALDFGCGEFYPITLLLTDAGVKTTGVDVAPMTNERRGFNHWQSWMVARMENHLGRSLPVEQVKLVRYEGTRLPFDDATFDFVHSNSVFEHLPDLQGSLREIRRVMKPQGVGWISIHYFPSIAGFHPIDKPYYYSNPLVLPPDEKPWRHLLDETFPVPEDLNRLREQDFQQAIAAGFEVLEYKTHIRGEQYLTPELEAEVIARGFTRRDALTHVGQFVLRPKTQNDKGTNS